MPPPGRGMGGGMAGMRSFRQDRSVLEHRVKKGTTRRMLQFALPYRRVLIFFLVVVVLAGGLAIADAALSLYERRVSAMVGEGLIFDMRSKVFRHIQKMPLAFFTRTQTGALVRDIGIAQALYARLFMVALTLTAYLGRLGVDSSESVRTTSAPAGGRPPPATPPGRPPGGLGWR